MIICFTSFPGLFGVRLNNEIKIRRKKPSKKDRRPKSAHNILENPTDTIPQPHRNVHDSHRIQSHFPYCICEILNRHRSLSSTLNIGNLLFRTRKLGSPKYGERRREKLK